MSGSTRLDNVGRVQHHTFVEMIGTSRSATIQQDGSLLREAVTEEWNFIRSASSHRVPRRVECASGDEAYNLAQLLPTAASAVGRTTIWQMGETDVGRSPDLLLRGVAVSCMRKQRGACAAWSAPARDTLNLE